MHGRGRRDVGEILAYNVKRLRKGRGYSQEQLEERSGVSQTMISAIERNATSPGADTLQALAMALGVEPWQLQIDGLADDLLFGETLPHLVNSYRGLSAADRQAIDSLIARLARNA